MIEISNVSMIFKDSRAGIKFLQKDDKELTEGLREKALDEVSFNIPDGCIYGFLGSNGAGKSTLMRMICGIYRTDMGSIKIDGKEVYNNSEAKQHIFFVNDETIEYTKFTMTSLMKYYKSYYPDTFREDVFFRLAETLNLPMNSPLSSFSKGMKRQAVVIVGLAASTKYIMLDEAFDGLDPAMRNMIKNIILDEIRSRNATLIVSSHNIIEIGEMCDRVMLVHKGKLIFADEIRNVKGRFRKYQLVRLSGTVTKEELDSRGIDYVKYETVGSVVHIIAQGTEDLNEKINMLEAELTEEIPLTLDEIFLFEMRAKGYGNDII